MNPSDYHHHIYRCAEPEPCARQFTNWRMIAFAAAALVLAWFAGAA